MKRIKIGFWAMGILIFGGFSTPVHPDQYVAEVRFGVGRNYGPPDPNSGPSRIGDDFFNPDSSLVWWTMVAGQGQITIVYDSVFQKNILKITAGSSPCNLVTEFPATGSLNSKKRRFVLFIKDEDPLDSCGYQVDCKVKAQIAPSTYKWYTLRYISENGANSESGDTVNFYLGSGYRDGSYHDINRSLEEDLRQFHSSYYVTLFDTLLVRGGKVSVNWFFM